MIMVTTKTGSHYTFSKGTDGKWHLQRHSSEYILAESVSIRKGRKLVCTGFKINAFTCEVAKNETNLQSSPVEEIYVDGKYLKGFKAWKGITIGA